MNCPVDSNSMNDNNTAKNNDLTLELNDNESQEKNTNTSGAGAAYGITDLPTLESTSTSNGYYDAEKCRAYIANQIKVNKIDRFALQISGASDVETSNQIRVENLMNMFTKCSSKVMHDFTMRCKLGVQSHRQDRILNCKAKKGSSLKLGNKQKNNIYKSTKLIRNCNQQKYYYSSISNDLLYGVGAQLVRELLLSTESISMNNNQLMKKNSSTSSSNNKISIDIEEEYKKSLTDNASNKAENKISALGDDDYILSDYFEPKLFVKKMEDLLRANINKSTKINAELSKISQIFESLASKHRGKVDKVYSAEEERQATSVTRRSAYNLSVAAIKATSIPVHINTNSND